MIQSDNKLDNKLEDLLERLQTAASRIEAMANESNSIRLSGKLEGINLAIGYLLEIKVS